MNIVRCFALILLLLQSSGVYAQAAIVDEQALFGPVQFDMKDRYGALNRYAAKFSTVEDVYLIKLQNGATPDEKVDWLECSVNGETIVRGDKYPFPFIAVFVKLKSENTIEIAIRDDVPTGLRRPPATPKNIIVTVFPVSASRQQRLRGSFGIMDWSKLNDLVDRMLSVPAPFLTFAMETLNLQYEAEHQAEALRKLADRAAKQTELFFASLFGDLTLPALVRAEAAVSLGRLKDKKYIPWLMVGFVDPNRIVSEASARALSFYPEEDTEKALTETLEKLDYFRKDGAIRTIAESGWKPVSTLKTLADSDDPHASEIALAVLGGLQDPMATEYLLAALVNPGRRPLGAIIRALGDTKDPRAVEALLPIASDVTKRSGREIDLADALAKLGDQRAAGIIVDMSKNASSPFAYGRLRAAYRTLTGKDL